MHIRGQPRICIRGYEWARDTHSTMISTAAQPGTSYRMADGLRWAVEKRGVTLVTPQGAVCTLIYRPPPSGT